MKISVIIATHRPEGIERVASAGMPALPDVDYVVSWQDHQGAAVPQSLMSRKDVSIIRYDGSGLSNNRNNALRNATGDVIIIADDDVTLRPDGIERLRDAYISNPGAALITFRSVRPGGGAYPCEETALRLPLPKNYMPCSIEISFRKSGIGNLEFCPEMGLGAPDYTAGEETLFLLAAIKRGLECRFIPVTVAEHPSVSTGGKTAPASSVMRANGICIALQYPATAVLRVPLKAWRMFRYQKVPFLKALYHMTAGAIAACQLRKRNKRYLW